MQLSRRLLSPVGNERDTALLGPAVLSILLRELQSSLEGESREHIEYATVAYLAVAGMGGLDGELRRLIPSDARSPY